VHRRALLCLMHKMAEATASDSYAENIKLVFCDLCKYNDAEVEARAFCDECDEHLCSSCSDFHRRSRKLKDHVLTILAGDHASVECSKHDEFMCKTHGNKKYKYFCIDHHTYCCSKCLIDDNHRFCENLKTLEDYIATKSYTELKDVVKQKVNTFHDACIEIEKYERMHKSFLRQSKEFLGFSRKFMSNLRGQHVTASKYTQIKGKLNDLQEKLTKPHLNANEGIRAVNAIERELKDNYTDFRLAYFAIVEENKTTCQETSRELQKLTDKINRLCNEPIPSLERLDAVMKQH